MAVGDIYEVRVFSLFLEQVAVNVLHYRSTEMVGAPGASQAALLAALAVSLPIVWRPCMVTDSRFSGLTIRKVHPVETAYQFTTATAGPGTGSAAANVRQTSGLVSKYTATPGRHGRGRIYIPFPGQDDVDPDTTLATDTYWDKLEDIRTAILATVPTGGGGDTEAFVMCVYNRESPATSPVLTSGISRRKFATQRRRGSFGAANALPF